MLNPKPLSSSCKGQYLVRCKIPEDPHYEIATKFSSLSPPLFPNIPISGVFFHTLNQSPFINQNVFTPNHVSVTAPKCGGVHALVTIGHRVYLGI
jgi:hypothetical protein